MNVKLFVVLLLVFSAVIFIVQNVAVVELRFLFWTMDMSRALMFMVFMLVGVIVGWLMRGHFSRRPNKD